jgi:hypothetical protein
MLNKRYPGDHIKKHEMGGALWHVRGEGILAYMVLVWQPEGKRTLGRPRRRWENNITMDIQEIVWRVDIISLAQYRDGWRAVVSAVMNRRVP